MHPFFSTDFPSRARPLLLTLPALLLSALLLLAAASPAAAQVAPSTEPTLTEPTSTEPASTEPTSAAPTTAVPPPAAPASDTQAPAPQAPAAEISAAQASAAATAGALPPEAVADLEKLVSTLTDEAARTTLVQQLRTLIEAQRAVTGAPAADAPTPEKPFGAKILDRLSTQVAHLGSQVLTVANTSIDLPEVWDWLVAQVADPINRNRWAEILLKVVLALGAGVLVEAGVRWALSRPRRAVEARSTERPLTRLVLLFARTVLELIPVLAFAAAAYAALPWLDMRVATQAAILAIVNANVICRFVVALARMALAPGVPSLRFVGVSDAAALYLFRWSRRIARLGVYGYFGIRVLYILGISAAAYLVLLKLLGIGIAVLLIVLVLRNRVRVAEKLRGPADGRDRPLRRHLADLWHVVAILYIVATCLVWMLVDEGFSYLFRATLLTIVILVAVRIALTVARQVLRRAFAYGGDIDQASPTVRRHAVRYLPAIKSVVTGLVWAVAAVALIQAWGVPVLDYTGTGFVGPLLRIGLVIAVGVALWEGLRMALDRPFRRSDEEGNLIQASARARTLIPLLEKFAFIVIAAVVTLMVLAEIGVDIGPLLAGAGIVGIAVGFGAQSLVKDVITGLFILIEDQFAIGDVVTASGKTGTVEAISLRTMKLRAEDGTIFTIPYSEVTNTANLTRGFSTFVFKVGIAYRENIDEVIAALQTLGEEIGADPEYAPLILAPFEVAGVDELGESAVVIKCTIRTLPSGKWKIGREMNRRIKNRFDELGIELPFPHQTIYFGVDKRGEAPPVRVVLDGPAGKPAARDAGAPAADPSTSGSPAAGASAAGASAAGPSAAGPSTGLSVPQTG